MAVFFGFFIAVNTGVHFLNLKALEWRKKRVDTINELDRQLVKMIMSKFEILQNDRIDREIGVLERYADDAKRYNLGLNNYLVGMFSMPNFVFFAITVSVLFSLFRIPLPYASLVSIFMMTGILKETMAESIDFFKNFTKNSYTVQKMWLLFDDAPKMSGLLEGKKFTFGKGTIETENLSFDYHGNRVFQDFSLKIAGGKKTALVGLSGSGKTTLVKLIAGYLRPSGGAVLVD